MRRGRRTTGVQLVERLEGSAQAKRRLRLVLETLAGQRTVTAAGQALGISRRRFHALRSEFLQAALDELEPRSVGRPGRNQDEDDRVAGLEVEIQKLQVELRASQVREEIALAMPHLLRRARTGKKARARKTRRARSSAVEKPVT
jgi:hypothetical protein